MSEVKDAVDAAKLNIMHNLLEIQEEIDKVRQLHGDGISFKIWMEQDDYPEEMQSERSERAFIWLNTDRTDQLLGVAARMDV